MNVAQIFAALEYDTGELPREALEQAIRNKEALTPKLIDCIINARNHPEIIQQKDRFYMGHIHAMYLLAQFREKAAYAPIVDLFASLPADVIDEPVGDIITEDLHRILPSVSGGDDALIRTLIEQETASPYVRAAAVQSFITMIVAGLKSREQVIDYYSQLFKGGLKRKASLTWDELVSCTTDLRARELLEEIQRAYDEDLFGEDYISINEIKNGMKKSADTALKYLSMNRAYSLINDTIKDMKRFEFYRDINEDEDLDSDDDPIPDLKPVRTTPKTGRNDPCPCGSGKKYKKCCGKNV